MKNNKYLFYVYKMRLEKGLSLKFNLIMELAGSLCFFVLHLITAYLISINFHFPGWSLGDYWVLIATFEIFTYAAFFFLWRGVNVTYKDIAEGTFDYVLTTPVNSRAKAFLRGGNINNLVAVALGITLLFYVVSTFNIRFSAFTAILYVLVIATSIWLIHCIDVICLSLNFKYGKIEATKGPLFNFQQAMKYPADSFLGKAYLSAIIIFPIALLTTVPTIVFLQKSQYTNFVLIYFVIIGVFTILSEYMWRWGLKNYTSAS